jgi:hypothetical protein
VISGAESRRGLATRRRNEVSAQTRERSIEAGARAPGRDDGRLWPRRFLRGTGVNSAWWSVRPIGRTDDLQVAWRDEGFGRETVRSPTGHSKTAPATGRVLSGWLFRTGCPRHLMVAEREPRASLPIVSARHVLAEMWPLRDSRKIEACRYRRNVIDRRNTDWPGSSQNSVPRGNGGSARCPVSREASESNSLGCLRHHRRWSIVDKEAYWHDAGTTMRGCRKSAPGQAV